MKLSSKNICFGILFCLITFLNVSDSQSEISFQTSVNTNQIEEGGFIKLTFKVVTDQKLDTSIFQDFNFTIPNFTEMKQFRAGPFPKSSFQSFNGRTSQSFSITLETVLRPDKIGELLIPAFEMEYLGKKISTKPIKIHVSKSSSEQSIKNKYFENDEALPAYSKHDGLNRLLKTGQIFLVPRLERSKIVLGDVVQVKYYLYAQAKIRKMIGEGRIKLEPRDTNFSNFTIQGQKMGDGEWEVEEIDGIGYSKVLVYQVNLLPQKLGEQKIEPWFLFGSYAYDDPNYRRNRYGHPAFDSLFGSSVRSIPFVIPTPELTVEINPLPTKDKPENFNGAVGNFSVDLKLDKEDVPQNEVLALRLTVSGNGNFTTVDAPALPTLAQFEQYGKVKSGNVVVEDEINLGGKKVFEYVLRPIESGDLEIPPLQFAYYDVDKQRYQNLKTESLKVNVTPVSKNGAQPLIVAPAQNSNGNNDQRQAVILNEDIQHIMTQGFTGERSEKPLIVRASFWGFQTIPLFLIIVSLFIQRQNNKYRDDHGLVRKKGAKGVARKRLMTAQKMLKANDTDHFYQAITNGMRGFLSDHFNTSEQGLTINDIRIMMQEKDFSEDLVQRTILILEKCDQARYAPGSDNLEEMNRVFTEASDTINELSRSL